MERNEKVRNVPEHPIRTKLFVVATTMVLLGAVLTAVTLGIFGSAPVLATILAGDGTAPTTTMKITPWVAGANNNSTVAHPGWGWNHTAWNTQNVTMNLTATAGGVDALANISYRINGGPWLNYSSATIVGKNVTLNQTMVGSKGNITINFRSTDVLGDMEIYKTNVTWIDTEKPTVSVVATVGTAGANDWYTSAVVKVKLVAADNVNGSGVNTTYYTNGTEAIKAVNCTTTLPTLVMSGEGTHNLTAAAKDNATNNGTVTDLAVKIDSVAPTLTLTNASGSISKNKTTLAWTASDATSGIDHYEVKVGSGAFVAVGTVLSYQVTGLAEGNNTVIVKAVDKAGNSVDKTIYLTVSTPAAGSDMTLILVILAIIVVIVIVVVMMMKRKGKSPVDVAAPEEIKPSN